MKKKKEQKNNLMIMGKKWWEDVCQKSELLTEREVRFEPIEKKKQRETVLSLTEGHDQTINGPF
jgi:hypothetical protein